MRTLVRLWLLFMTVGFGGCGSNGSTNSTTTPNIAATTPSAIPSATPGAGHCTARLVRLRTGQDSACSGGNEHL